jgi:hypothetical protein
VQREQTEFQLDTQSIGEKHGYCLSVTNRALRVSGDTRFNDPSESGQDSWVTHKG